MNLPRPTYRLRVEARMEYPRWTGLASFAIGVLPALLVFYIRSGVQESPVWRAGQARNLGARDNLFRSIARQPMLYVYAIPANTPLDDLDTWKAANPASWRTKERIAEDLADEFVDEPTKRRLYGNEWTGHRDRWIDDDHWDAAKRAKDSIPRDVTLVCGVDAARTRDTTALGWAWLRPDGKVTIRSRVWSVREEVAHDVFVPGGRLDNNLVRDYIRQVLMPAFHCKLLFYDERYFDTQANDLSNDGMTVVEMHQGKPEMNRAWDEFYDALYKGPDSTTLHDGGETVLG